MASLLANLCGIEDNSSPLQDIGVRPLKVGKVKPSVGTAVKSLLKTKGGHQSVISLAVKRQGASPGFLLNRMAEVSSQHSTETLYNRLPAVAKEDSWQHIPRPEQ